MHRTVLLTTLALALLLAAPTASADHADNPGCGWDMPAIDLTQCIANSAIDTAEHEAQDAVRTACIAVFGEPC